MSLAIAHNYGFKSLESLKSYVDEYVLEDAKQLTTAYRCHYDTVMLLEDAETLLALCKDA